MGRLACFAAPRASSSHDFGLLSIRVTTWKCNPMFFVMPLHVGADSDILRKIFQRPSGWSFHTVLNRPLRTEPDASPRCGRRRPSRVRNREQVSGLRSVPLKQKWGWRNIASPQVFVYRRVRVRV